MSLIVKPVGRETLRGKRVALEMAAPEHAEFLTQTYNLDEFMDCYRLAQDRNVSVEDVKQRLEKEQEYSPQQMRRIEWVIKLGADTPDGEAQVVGIAALADYQPAHNRAELLIGIPDADQRVTGLSLEATLLVLEFAFYKAKLHKLVSYVYAFNESSQKNTVHLGFQQEGLLHDHYFNHRTGQYVDLYQNCLLKKDFFENKKIGRWSKRLLGRDITLKNTPPEMRSMSANERKHDLNEIIKNLGVQES